MPASTYVGNAILNCYLRGVAPTPPTVVYVSLHTADPGNSGVNEVTTAAWPAYVRKNAAGGGALTGAFDVPASKATENAIDMLWPANNGAAPVVVTHFAIWDAASAGNCLFYGPLAASKTLNVTDEVMVYADQLDVAVT